MITIKSEDLNLHSLKAISPIDGRHRLMTEPLADCLSEYALFKYRVFLETEYLIALSKEKNFKEIREFTLEETEFLRNLVNNFTLPDAQVIQNIDRFGYKDIKATNHDTKATEYYVKLKIKDTSLQDVSEFVHFGLTGDDVNNIALSKMIKIALEQYYLPKLVDVLDCLCKLAEEEKGTPLLGKTHGQPATPTTFGKEMANYLERLRKEAVFLQNFQLPAKINGAVGNHNAQHFAAPEVDWIKFSENFLKELELEPNLLTTQVEPHDGLTRLFSCLISINNIIRDFCIDMWIYISDGYLTQQKIEGEVGSSTMPHKINPWRMEVAEGDTVVTNGLLSGFISKMQTSRLQRDLSDHLILRSGGNGIAHCYVIIDHVLEELKRLSINRIKLLENIQNYGSVLTEAVQTLLRKEGYSQPYELLKDFSRGKHCTVQELHDFVDTLEIKEETKLKLKSLRPENYIGLSKELTELAIKRWKDFKEEYEEPLPAVKKVFLDPEIKTVEIVEQLKQMEITVLDELVSEKGVLFIGKMNSQFEEAKEKGLICINYDPERKTKAEYNIIDLSELPDLINSFGGN